MKVARTKARIVSASEYALAILLTLGAFILHIRVLTHAGPLWRDEINGLNVALMPTLKEIWQSIVHYPFPILHDLILRFWIACGFGDDDFQLRILAFLIAVLFPATLWLGCRMLGQSAPPILPLALLTVNPVVIQNGDWLRPYALAMIFIVLVFASIWRLTSRDCDWRMFCFATLLTILSVQVVFQNAVLVFAICAAGIAVSLYHRHPKRAWRIFVAGAAAALSLLPYFPVLRLAREWSSVVRTDYSVGVIATAGLGAMAGHRPVVAVLWLLIPICLVAAAWFAQRENGETGDRIGFGIVSLIVGAIGTIAFVSVSGWLMDRYFMPFAAVAAMCVYLFAGQEPKLVVRLASIVISIILACVMAGPAWTAAAARATNCDLIAAQLTREAGPEDLILLSSFTYGMSFSRYYHGVATWRTIPEIPDHAQHRWDLALQVMKQPDPMRDTLSEIETALRDGHKVFLIGALPAGNAPSTNDTGSHWNEDALRNQVGQFLRGHTLSRGQLPVAGEQQMIHELEDLPLFVGTGWRD